VARSALLCALAAGCAVPRVPAPPRVAPSPHPSPSATPTPTPTATAAPTPAPCVSATHAARRRTVVLLGDSTTYGTAPKKEGLQSPYNPGASLEALLAIDPEPSPWRGARVYDLAVGASSTPLWLASPPVGCKSVLTLFPVVKAACAAKVPWVKAVPLAVDGHHVDAAIIDLGINDLLVTRDPEQTVDRLVAIRRALKPIPVLFFPPIAPPDGPRGDWPERVRAAMEKRGLFSGKQYPPYVPTFDGLHPTDGGYAAKAGLWLDGLRKLP
jgi:lysophospholipase L1-like esterase